MDLSLKYLELAKHKYAKPKAEDLQNIVYSLAKLGITDLKIYSKLFTHIKAQTEKLSNKDVALLIWALCKLE